MKVDVYQNLNRDCISVRSREGETYGRVVAHVDSAVVRDATFVVQPAGRDRVRQEEQRNVHAFVRGTWRHNTDRPFTDGEATEVVVYDPYEYDSFVVQEPVEPVETAPVAFVQPGRVEIHAR